MKFKLALLALAIGLCTNAYSMESKKRKYREISDASESADGQATSQAARKARAAYLAQLPPELRLLHFQLIRAQIAHDQDAIDQLRKQIAQVKAQYHQNP